MARKSEVHLLTTNDAIRTACNIHLFGHASNRRAPVCSTNHQHITCAACLAALDEGLALDERTAR